MRSTVFVDINQIVLTLVFINTNNLSRGRSHVYLLTKSFFTTFGRKGLQRRDFELTTAEGWRSTFEVADRVGGGNGTSFWMG